MKNLNNIDSALKELSAQYSDKNINVMFANRIKDGQLTDEKCVTFIVEDKLPLDQLTAEDVLPSEVIVDNLRYLTDVIELKDGNVLSCPSPCVDWETTPPGNRNTVRPLKGGLSIGSKSNIVSPTECVKGTLGFIAVDKATQALVGVTSSHIVVKNPFITMNQNLTGLVQNEKDNYVYQNGETCTVNPALQIGQVIRYAPLYTTPVPDLNPNSFNFIPSNYVDAALISLKQSDISNTESFKQYGVDYNLPLPFATSNEIWDLANTRPTLYSSGRTTGSKGDPCKLYFYGIIGNNFLVNGYNLQGQDVGSTFANFILFLPNYQGCIAAAPGDSGSALIADIGGVRKIIGVVFASAKLNGIDVGIACRIDWVAEQLGIEAWDGTPKNFIDPASIEYTSVPGKSYDPFIKKNGKVYWQLGLTNI